ncbi:patatin-like phospholipase family protein [Pseudorhodoferax sp. LjRoot39]|uniref:patatin-like phospholipase family protein n=1 Tax=Pseudorhodoferax sp. LjRoot39 TaxID=3342328 RepID=UPI003ECC963A
MNAAPIPQRTVTLVIGSGSVKCAASIGVVKALSEAGIGIDRVVGCSGGALFAAGVAFGFDAARMTDITLRTWTRQVTAKRNHMGMLRLLAPKLFGFRADSFGLRDDAPMLAAFRAVFGDRRIEDAPIPLHITATDFANGELVELTRGDLVAALRASASLPLAFKPVALDGKLLVDGYLADPMPVSVAMKNGSRVIVALGFETPYQENIRSASRFASQLSAILANNLQKSRVAFHSATHHSEMILIVPQFKERVRLFDTHKVPYIIQEGEEAARQQLPYLQALFDADRQHLAAA